MSLQYVIDGYNIINHPLFSSRAKKFKADIQSALIWFIRTNKLTGSMRNKLIIVFDGYPPVSMQSSSDSDTDIIFSRKISADEKIEQIVEKSTRRSGIVVVSNDKQICFVAKSLGARAMPVEEFLDKETKAKDRLAKHKADDEDKLNYTQMHKINEELKEIWLKQK